MMPTPPEPSSATPRDRSPGHRFNFTAGIVVLGLMLVLIVYFLWLAPGGRGKGIRVFVYQHGTVELEKGIRVVYNGAPVGEVDAIAPRIACVQLLLRDDAWPEEEWEVLTLRCDTSESADLADGLRIAHVSAPGQPIEVLHESTLLFRITGAGEGKGLIDRADSACELRVNARTVKSSGVEIRSGDEVSFARPGLRGSRSIRWQERGFYTRIEARVDSEALHAQSMAAPGRVRLNGVAILHVSNMFGLAKTSAKLAPSYAEAFRDAGPDTPVELRAGNDLDLDGIKRTLAYFTDRRRHGTPPQNNAEQLAGRIDSAVDQVNRLLEGVRSTTVPATNHALVRLASTLDSADRFVRTDVRALLGDVRSLAGTAGPAAVRLADTATAALSGIQMRLDLLLEELRVTLLQTRRSLKAAGEDLHKTSERINGKEVK